MNTPAKATRAPAKRTKTTAAAVPAKAARAAKPPSPVAAPAGPPAAAAPLPKAAAPKPAKAPKLPKPKKAPKLRPQLVRDSFTMPEADFSLVATLKARALATQRHAKKSELLRAGLQALAAMDSKALVASLDRLEPVKIGRPKKA
jgi:hypothetical protein